MTPLPLLEVAGFAFFAALALTPLTSGLARATGYVDHPDPRKAHARATPLLGGIAIAAALVLAPLLAGAFGPGSVAAPSWGVVAGAVLLTLMPELFRFINDYKLLVYGGLLLVVMRFSPDGLAGLAGRLAGTRSQ